MRRRPTRNPPPKERPARPERSPAPRAAPAPPPPRSAPWLALVLATAFLRSWGLGAPFRLDDLPGVVDHAALRSFDLPGLLASFGVSRLATGLSLALQVRISGVASPLPFQAANLALLVAAAFGIGGLLARLLVPPSEARPAAAVGAAVVLAHPLAVEPVLYVFQRSVVLATAGAFLAVWAGWEALEPGRTPRRRAALVLGSLAALAVAATAKEVGLPMVAGLVGVVALVRRRSPEGGDFPQEGGPGRWRRVGIGAAVAVGALGLVALGWLVLGYGHTGEALARRLPGGVPWMFWRVQTVSFWRYVVLIAAPPVAPYAVSHAAEDPYEGWPPPALAAALLLFAAVALRRRAPALAFAGTWTFASLLPAMLVPGAAVVDYKAFPATASVAALAISAWSRLGSRRPGTRELAVLAAWALLVVPSLRYQQTFRTDRELWARALRVEPRNPAALLGMGEVLLAAGQGPEAEATFAAALELCRKRAGLPVLEPAPVEHFALLHLGNAAAARGDGPAAISAWRAALKVAPDFGAGHFNLGLGLLVEGEPAEAFREITLGFAADRTDLARVRHFFSLLDEEPQVARAFVRWLDEHPAGVEWRGLYDGTPGLREPMAEVRRRWPASADPAAGPPP